MAIIPQMRGHSARRRFVKRLLAVVALGCKPAHLLAQSNPLFEDRPEDLTGPLSQFADQLSTRANALGKPGRYPQELFERFEKGDKRARLELYSLSQEGDEYARTIVGWMFDNGVGAVRNSEQAAEMFILASVSIPLAQYNLGVLFLQGRGVPQNTNRAMEHLGSATRIPPAFVQFARFAISEKKGNAALHFAEKAARLRDPAGLYLYGRLLIEKGEVKKGAQFTHRAARADFPEAITSMVVLYSDGVGLPKDAGMAAGWWIIDSVLNQGQTLDSSEKAIERFDLNRLDRAKAIRF